MRFYTYVLGYILAVVTAAIPLAWSQEPKLSVQPNSGTTRDSFTFGITLDNPEPSSVPSLKDTQDFSVRYLGPQRSVRIINNSIETSIAYFFRLTPKRAGTLLTPPVFIEGAPIHTSPLTVEVSEPSDVDTSVASDILFDQFVTPTSVYRGQQVLNTFEIATTVKLSKPQIHYTPMTSFWTEEITPTDKDQIVKNGVVYTVIRSRRALFPLRSGTLIIPERRFSAVADRGRMNSLLRHFDPFDPNFIGSIMGGGGEEVNLTSSEKEITVIDLPPLPQSIPVWSTGDPVVGRTSLTVKSDKLHSIVGGTITVSVTIESEGNLNPISEVKWPEHTSWKIYQEQPQTHKRFENGKVIFSKEFRSSFIPASGGTLQIPSLKMGYFDPETATYAVAKSDSIEITVDGPVTSPAQVEEEESAENSSQLSPPEESTPDSSSDWRITILALIVCTAFLLASLRGISKSRNVALPSRHFIDPESVASIRTLHTVFIDGIHAAYPRSKTTQSIRAGLQEALLDSPKRFEIESLLDEIEESLFGSTKMITEEEFQRLKSSVFSYLTEWGLTK